MPKPVSTYLEAKDLGKVDMEKRRIVNLYAEDFRKIDPAGRMSQLFMSIPGQLSRNTRRYVPSAVIGRVGDDDLAKMMSEMNDSKTVNIAYQVEDPNVGMELTKNSGQYKLFVGDTGLFVTMAFWDKDFTENSIYQKLLSDKLSTNLGYIYENLIAQMLVVSGDKLFYHTWPLDEKHYGEIDFLVSRGNKICPIEVKSSSYKTHASLDAFCKKYSSRIGNRYLVYTKDLDNDGQTLLVPTYMAMFL